MCGIVGYVGKRDASRIIMDGLKKLEYRGYDSAGIAVISGGRLDIRRCKGKLAGLEAELRERPVNGSAGIGHTRWATHGRPSEVNAHPHAVGQVAVVHNGIIENYAALKRDLIASGAKFCSETDTEVIAHLLDQHLKEGMDFETALRKTTSLLKGAYSIVAVNADNPDLILAAKVASPLILGIGDGENFVASDVPAIIAHTRRVIIVEENEYAVITPQKVTVKNFSGELVSRPAREVTWTPAMAEKGGYKHFMLKEIFEQPRAIADTLAGRVLVDSAAVEFEDFSLGPDQLKSFKQAAIVACGTAWHAGLVGQYMIEGLAKVPVRTDIASEFRYRDPLVGPETLLILISQSGETADTLAALEEGKRRGCTILSICNVMGSSITRKSDHVIYTRSGPEIGVASTKAFTCQLTVLYLLALYWAKAKGTLPDEAIKQKLLAALHVPALVEEVLENDKQIQAVARKFYKQPGYFFIGRGINYPIALEGALKLKEISYIHAEGYPAGELKHGPIALVDENMPVLVLAAKNAMFDKVLSNLEEVAAREGKIIALVNPGDEDRVREKAAEVIVIPESEPELETIILTVPLQLLAYHVAVLNGTDVDQPRNLAKSVTVE
ncbi:MAG TPA: glutamine--fructose-6-phosphate transaminase (isomerizing) [bacterium]|nr:glutamine--fructose-6-phosphate transaminase (isomerizing) [bacterium]